MFYWVSYPSKEMVMEFRLFLIFYGLLIPLKNTYAAPYPTDIDLRAAYCTVVNKNLLNLIKPFENLSPEMKNEVVKKESMVQRLGVYSQQRLNFVDASPMISAMQFATKDIEESDKIVNACVEKFGGGREASLKCGDMPETELTKRLRRCNSINWLPY